MSTDQPRKTRVALVFGGRSSEHSVSCVTAASVLAAIDTERYDVVPIGITRDGRFIKMTREKNWDPVHRTQSFIREDRDGRSPDLEGSLQRKWSPLQRLRPRETDRADHNSCFSR